MRFNAWFALILASCILSAGPSQARDRALVVGVNKYPNLIFEHAHGGKDLRGAVADAETFVDLLVNIFHFDRSDIKLLTDAQATNRNILDGLQTWLIDGSQPGDRVVLYFSGHGATAAVRDADGKTRLTSTIVPGDAAGDLDQDNPVITGMIQGKTIGEYLARMPGRRIMVMADSCHSGSVTRDIGRAADDRLVRTITPRRPVGMTEAEFTPAVQTSLKTSNRLIEIPPRGATADSLVVWQAATIDQVAFDDPDRLGGVFTQNFADGLRDRKAALHPGGEVTAGRLINYVRDQSQAFCTGHSKVCQAGLTPDLKSEPAYRDFVLNPYPPPGTPPLPPSGQQVSADAENLLTHKNDFQVRAEILPGTQIKLSRPGRPSQVQFRITSAEAGTLVVLDTGPDGKLHQIFPNRRSQQNNKSGRVNAGAPITIPDASYGVAFTATDPGPGTLLVLVAEQALDLSGVIDRNLDFKAVTDPRGLVVELADRVQAPMISPDLTIPNRGYRWAFVAVPYVVEP
ncbi:MAG TPA: caspase family protein [Xanthobacteraceae bacterium]